MRLISWTLRSGSEHLGSLELKSVEISQLSITVEEI
jgi:hypothetical protein